MYDRNMRISLAALLVRSDSLRSPTLPWACVSVITLPSNCCVQLCYNRFETTLLRTGCKEAREHVMA